MKKILKLSFVLALVVSMLLPHCERVSAAEEGTVYAVDAATEGLSDASEKTDHASYDEYYGYISPKSSDGSGKIIFTIDADTAGKYTIGVVYAAKEGSAARKIGLAVNDGEVSLVNLACAEDWDTIKTYTTTVDFVAGQNTVVVSTPSDFDDDTVKTPNIYAVTFKLKEAAAEDTGSEDAGAAEEAGTPAEDTGAAEDTQPAELPKTGLADSAYFYCAGLLLVAGGAMVLLKKKQKEA